MASEPAPSFLLDEHYAGWVAEALRAAGVDAVALIAERPELRGVDDTTVLELARREGRVVVTEDVTTFSVAIAAVPDHRGVVFCHHGRFPRTKAGLSQLVAALAALAASPPTGLGELPVVCWLSRTD